MEPFTGTGNDGNGHRSINCGICRCAQSGRAADPHRYRKRGCHLGADRGTGGKSDAAFQRNEALWDKVDEACNALPDDYDFENFDEAAFIRNMTTLTEAEKETLLNDIKELNELDAQMEKLYGQLPACDNMPLYEKALEKADPKVLDEIDTLEQEYDRLCEKNADLWDKVDEAYFNLPDDYDFDNYDEAAFIRSLSFLTDAEKDALIADYNRLVELDNQLCKLYDTIWGDTGCESGICPFDGKEFF